MADTFIAQSLVETGRVINERRFEMTFVDAHGRRPTISLPVGVAADLAPVLQALMLQGGPGKTEFTRSRRQWRSAALPVGTRRRTSR